MLFVGTIYASKQGIQTRNAIQIESYFRNVMGIFDTEANAYLYFLNECHTAYPETESFGNHRISVTQMPDEIIIYAAKELLDRLNRK